MRKFGIDGRTEASQFLGAYQLLHTLEQFALLAVDVGRESRGELADIGRSHRGSEGCAQANVIEAQVIYKLSQFFKTLGRGKDDAFLGVKVEADLVVEKPECLCAQGGELVVVRARDADA